MSTQCKPWCHGRVSLLLYPPLLLEAVASEVVLTVSETGELEVERKGDARLRDGGEEEKKPGVRGDGDKILMGDEAGGAFRRTRLAGILMRLHDGGEFEEMLIGDEFGVVLERARFVAERP